MMDESFNKRMKKLKHLSREVKKELLFHEDAESWKNKKQIKQFNRIRKHRSNVRRKLKKLGLLGAYQMHVWKTGGKYYLHLRKKSGKQTSLKLENIKK